MKSYLEGFFMFCVGVVFALYWLYPRYTAEEIPGLVKFYFVLGILVCIAAAAWPKKRGEQ